MENEDIRARKLMYNLAEERGLLPQIIMLCADARKKGDKIGSTDWTVNGLLRFLGLEIEDKDGVRCPFLCEDNKI